MRNKWLIVALIFSVAINGAALVTIGCQWWERRQPPGPPPPIGFHRKALQRRLNLTEDQIQRVRDARGAAAKKMKAMRKSLRSKRTELARLLMEPEPDRAEIDARLKEIAALQLDLERLVVDDLLRLKEVLTPEQQERLLSIIEHRLHKDRRHPVPGWRGRHGRFAPW